MVKAKRRLFKSPQKEGSIKKAMSKKEMQLILQESPKKTRMSVMFRKKANPVKTVVEMSLAAKRQQQEKPGSKRINWTSLATEPIEEWDEMKSKEKLAAWVEAMRHLVDTLETQGSLAAVGRAMEMSMLGEIREMQAEKIGPMNHNGRYPVIDHDVLRSKLLCAAAADGVSVDELAADEELMVKMRKQAIRQVNPATVMAVDIEQSSLLPK